jgi:hypothetical protein
MNIFLCHYLLFISSSTAITLVIFIFIIITRKVNRSYNSVYMFEIEEKVGELLTFLVRRHAPLRDHRNNNKYFLHVPPHHGHVSLH